MLVQLEAIATAAIQGPATPRSLLTMQNHKPLLNLMNPSLHLTRSPSDVSLFKFEK